MRAAEVTAQHVLRSPYRCRECDERFWVVSRNTYYLASVIGIALTLGTLAWTVGSVGQDHASTPEAEAHAERLANLNNRAEAGDPTAEYELATRYMTGLGVVRKEPEAVRWLERSAGHGNAEAQYELGLALRDGHGVIQDFNGAMQWISRAAEGGYGRAQLALGIMYRQGVGTPVDNAKAYTWLNVAAAQGVSGAAVARDAVRTQLSPAEIESAQVEARRLMVSQPQGAESNVPDPKIARRE